MKDNAEIYLKETGREDMDWIHVTHNRTSGGLL
jgi:hypothetical protein